MKRLFVLLILFLVTNALSPRVVVTFTNSSMLTQAHIVKPPLQEVKRYGRRLVLNLHGVEYDFDKNRTWLNAQRWVGVVSVEQDLMVSFARDQNNTRSLLQNIGEEGLVLQEWQVDAIMPIAAADMPIVAADMPIVAADMPIVAADMKKGSYVAAALEDDISTTFDNEQQTTPADFEYGTTELEEDASTPDDEAMTTAAARGLWQWNLDDKEPYSIHVEKAWGTSVSSPSYVVAVLDTGLARAADSLFF